MWQSSIGYKAPFFPTSTSGNSGKFRCTLCAVAKYFSTENICLVPVCLLIISTLGSLAFSCLMRSILKVFFATARVLSSASRPEKGTKLPLTFTAIPVHYSDLVLAQPSQCPKLRRFAQRACGSATWN